MRPFPCLLRTRPNLHNPGLHSQHKPLYQYISREHLNGQYHRDGRDDDDRLKPLIILHDDSFLRSGHIHHEHEQCKEPQREQQQHNEEKLILAIVIQELWVCNTLYFLVNLKGNLEFAHLAGEVVQFQDLSYGSGVVACDPLAHASEVHKCHRT